MAGTELESGSNKNPEVNAEETSKLPCLQIWRGTATYKVYQQFIHGSAAYAVQPFDYTGAAGELLALTLLLSWIIAWSVDAPHLKDNPLKDRFGYNNVCVAWDAPPALYVAPVGFTFIIILFGYYVYYDQLRAELDIYLPRWLKRMFLAINIYVGLSYTLGILLFVITPFTSGDVHTYLFLNIILAMMFDRLANGLETSFHTTLGWTATIYLWLMVLDSLGLILIAVIQIATYDESTKTMGPIPWWFMWLFDICWFLLLGVGPQSLNEGASVSFHLTFEPPQSEHYKYPSDPPTKASPATVGASAME